MHRRVLILGLIGALALAACASKPTVSTDAAVASVTAKFPPRS